MQWRFSNPKHHFSTVCFNFDLISCSKADHPCPTPFSSPLPCLISPLYRIQSPLLATSKFFSIFTWTFEFLPENRRLRFRLSPQMNFHPVIRAAESILLFVSLIWCLSGKQVTVFHIHCKSIVRLQKGQDLADDTKRKLVSIRAVTFSL